MAVICFTLILITGIVSWWPRNRKILKNRLTVKTSKGFRRFVYDSHVSLGIYAVAFLLLMSQTGPSWSFHWYRQGATHYDIDQKNAYELGLQLAEKAIRP